MSEERAQILSMVQEGKISADEAVLLLKALNGGELPDEVHAQAAPDDVPLDEVELADEQEMLPPDVPARKNWWLYLAAVGAVVMAVGAPFMVLGLAHRAHIFWALLCGWGPFFTGLAILTLGAWSRGARWLHLRVTNAHGGARSVAISLPLPLGLTAWIVRVVRPFVPQLKKTGVDETILALGDELGDKDGQPFYIDVQNDEGGEHVQVYIG